MSMWDKSSIHCFFVLVLAAGLFLAGSVVACLPARSEPAVPTPPLTPPIPPTPSEALKNQVPVIKSIKSEKEVIISSESQFICEASDSDGSDLRYFWSAGGGMIKSEGSTVTWVAPETPGVYNIDVMVLDDNGGQATSSVTVSVVGTPNKPPSVKEMTIEGSPPNEGSLKLRIWTTVTIQCIAEDPEGDKLSYVWSTTGGKIHGQGVEIGWLAPGVAGNYTVTVTVRDDRGGQATSSLGFEVVCCNY